MKILVNGTEKELRALDNGIDWTADLIGMTAEIEHDEDGNVIMDQETFDWWIPVIDSINRITEIQNECKALGRSDEFDQTVSIIGDCDLDHQTAMQLAAAEDLYKTIVDGEGERTSVFMIKTLSIHDGHRRDAYYACEFGNVHFRTEEEAKRFLIACDYIPDESTNVWNYRPSLGSFRVEEGEIVNKFVTVEHFKESEHLLAFLESYQAEQKKQYKSTLQEIEEMER